MENETQTQQQARPVPFRINGDRAALFTALAKARAEFPELDAGQTADVQKDGRSLYKFDYADLASLQKATVPALSKHGMCITQPWWSEGDGFVVLTILAHESGATMESETYFERPVDWQKMGSALTYVQRYQWRSVCGISASKDDDDANAAVGNNGTQITSTRRQGSNGNGELAGGAPDPQLEAIREIAAELDWSKGQVQAFALKLGIKKQIDQMTQAEGKTLIGALTAHQIEARNGAAAK